MQEALAAAKSEAEVVRESEQHVLLVAVETVLAGDAMKREA